MARDEERVIHTKCNRERFEDEKEKKLHILTRLVAKERLLLIIY